MVPITAETAIAATSVEADKRDLVVSSFDSVVVTQSPHRAAAEAMLNEEAAVRCQRSESDFDPVR
jgi:hypothetical protein